MTDARSFSPVSVLSNDGCDGVLHQSISTCQLLQIHLSESRDCFLSQYQPSSPVTPPGRVAHMLLVLDDRVCMFLT